MMGMKMRSTSARASSWMWPCTSFAGEADSVGWEAQDDLLRTWRAWTGGRGGWRTRASATAFQNGMVSQNARTARDADGDAAVGRDLLDGPVLEEELLARAEVFICFRLLIGGLSARRVAGSFEVADDLTTRTAVARDRRRSRPRR